MEEIKDLRNSLAEAVKKIDAKEAGRVAIGLGGLVAVLKIVKDVLDSLDKNK